MVVEGSGPEGLVTWSPPFDAVAGDYDRHFSNTALGRMLRNRIWTIVEPLVKPNLRILELNGGTGEDALWLLRQKCSVVLTDQSQAMLDIATQKLSAVPGTKDLQIMQLDLDHPEDSPVDGHFDGILSNFGGLNMVTDLPSFGRFVQRVVKPGGFVVLTVMGSRCVWETGWYLLSGHWRKAFRRWSALPAARIGQRWVTLQYPSPGTLRSVIGPQFHSIGLYGIGFLIPPTWLSHVVERSPGFFMMLNRMEQFIQRWTWGLSDHYVLVLKKRMTS